MVLYIIVYKGYCFLVLLAKPYYQGISKFWWITWFPCPIVISYVNNPYIKATNLPNIMSKLFTTTTRALNMYYSERTVIYAFFGPRHFLHTIVMPSLSAEPASIT